MTASATFDVIFVGAGHNALIAARYLAEDSGSVCLLDQPDASKASCCTV
jgi:phytoene dehydrogenase-like protein